jgi:hypothetical protein
MIQNACGESHTAANGVFGKIRPPWKNIGKNIFLFEKDFIYLHVIKN